MGNVIKKFRSFKRVILTFVALIILSVLLIVTFTVYAANILWSSAGGSAWLTGSNWTGGAVPSGTDVAQFGANPTGTGGVGINMNGTTNNGANNQAVGAIEQTSARTLSSNLVGNNSTTANGTLTLNGTTVNSVNNVILRNNSSQLFTIQDTQGSGNKTMGVALGNATDNVINIDSTGGITISSIISGSGRKLTLGGTGPGVLTLSGANTFTGGMTLGSGRSLNINNASALGTGTFTISGGTINNSSGATITLSTNNAQTWNGNFTFTGTNDLDLGTGAVSLGSAVGLSRTITISGGTLTVGGIISTATSANALTKSGGGTLTLTGANTYTGDTTISNGTLTLSAGGSIANSSNIVIAGGATFDVSGLTTALTLASEQGLKASGTVTTGTIATTTGKGLTTAANTPIQFTAFNGTTAPLTVTGAGTVTLAGGNTVTVTVSNGGTPLGAGDYKLIAKGTGNTTAVSGTAPSSILVTGDIASNTFRSLVISGGELFLHVATPTIAVTPGSLTFPNTIVGFSSAAQSYNVSGSNLIANLNITAPSTDFQVSTSSNSGFGSSVTLTPSGGTVASTQIFVRFTPQSTGAKSGNVTNASTGATTQNVAVSGTGFIPIITVTGGPLNFGNVVVGSISDEQNYTVSGINMTDNLVINAPTDFQISTTSGSGFGSSVTLTPSSGTVSTTTIYVRFAPSSVGQKDVAITHDSTGADTQYVEVLGNGIKYFSGSYNVCDGGTYPTLKSFFDEVNEGGIVTSNLIVNIAGDCTETDTALLNQWTESPAASNFTMTIRPSGGAARTISGNVSVSLVTFDGADRVTIDGLNSGGDSLTLDNSANSGSVITFMNDAMNNVVTNSTLRGGSGSNVINVTRGNSNGTTGNDNITITGNTIRESSTASNLPLVLVQLQGTNVRFNRNTTITNNDLKNFRGLAISCSSPNNATITGNTISNDSAIILDVTPISISSSTGTGTVSGNVIRNIDTQRKFTGILISTSTGAATVTGNQIYSIDNSSTVGSIWSGISASGSSGSNITVANNFVALTPNTASNQLITGLDDQCTSGVNCNFYYNTVLLGGTSNGSNNTWAYKRASVGNSTLQNNILYNNRSGGTGNHFAAGDEAANTGTFTSDYNFFVGTGATASNFFDYGSSSSGTPVSFAAWQTGPPTRDAHSIANTAATYNVNTFFTNAANGDLHINSSTSDTAAVSNTGTPVTGITTDIDNDTRNASTPDIGADEFNGSVTFNASGNLPAGTYNSIIVNAPAVVTLTGNVTITGSVIVNSGGTLDMGAFTISGGGTFMLNSGGTLGIGSPNGITSGVTASGNVQVTGTRTYSTGASYVYDGSANQAVGNGLPTTVANLTIANTGGGGSNTVTGNSGQIVTGLLLVQSGVYNSASDYVDVMIAPAGTLSLAANITVSGNWTNDGTFNANGFAVTFDGNTNQSISGTSSTAFAALNISNTGGNSVTLSQDISDTALNVNSDTFSQGAASSVTSGAVTVASGATWSNFGAGDLTLSGNVSNSGTITFNANGASCNDADDILIRSSVNNTQRTWSGTGTFSMTDVDVKDQRVPGLPNPPLAILVNSGTNSTNNTGWTFVNQCTAGTYTWIGGTIGVNTDWTVPTNWSPTRTTAAASDVLVFDGTSTPSPTVTNVAGASGETIARLNIINGAAPIFSANGARTLTINNGGGTALSIPSGNSLTLSGSNALRIEIASGSSGVIGGQIIVQGGGHRLIGNAASAITFQTGAIFTTSTGFTGNAFGAGGGDGATGAVVFQSGSSYFHNAGSSPFGSSANPAVAVFQTGSEADFLTATGFEANGRTYANLVVGNSMTQVSLSDSGAGNFQFDDLTVNSTSSANSSLTYNGSGSSTVTIQGNITSTGTGAGTVVSDVSLTAGTGGIVLNKAGTQTFSNSAGSRTVTFGSNATVNSGTTLALSRNLIVTPTSSSVLTISSGGTLTAGASGYVIGSLEKTVSGDTAFEVGTANGYSPVNLSNVTGSNVFIVSATQSSMLSIDPNKALHRYWTLTNGGITSAVLKFTYLATDVAGNEANYRIIKYTGTPPATFPEGTTDNVDESTHTATTTVPMSSFSDWSVAEPASVTAVRMESFKATNFGNGNLVEWQTGYEVDNLGFNVYRAAGGRLIRLTPSIVAGSALVAGRTPLTAGLSYSWFDPKGLSDSEYYVEDIDLSGARTMHGPIRTEFGGNTESPGRQQAALLSEIGNLQPDPARFVTGYPAAPTAEALERRQTIGSQPVTPTEIPAPAEAQPTTADSEKGVSGVPGQPVEGGLPVIEPLAGDGDGSPLEMQRTIAAGQAVKIAVRKAGWYRVSQAELVAAGLAPNANLAFLQLYADGVEQAILVRSGNGSRQLPEGSVEFYGTGMDTLTSDTRIYWLIVGSQPGKRIDSRQGRGSVEREVTSSLSAQRPSPKPPAEPSANAYLYTVERRDKIVYFNALLNGEADNFFGPVISKTAAKQDVTLSGIDETSLDPATLDVALQGVTAQAHKVRVVINGFESGVIDFSNVEHPVRQFQVPRSVLIEGNNSITLTSLNGDSDINLADYVRLTYSRAYRAEADALTFTSSHTTPFTVEGFTSPQIRVFDITDSNNVRQVSAQITQKGTGYAISVAGGDGSVRTLLALADSQVQHPAGITANEASNLFAGDNRADFIILTHRNFRDAVRPLADARASQGLETMVVDAEDIYDEFSYGAKSRQAIKDFLENARNNWRLAPHYVLFFGDASYDSRNYQGFGGQDLVPTKLVDATTLETSSDDALADFDGDGVADMAVGRLPVLTTQEAELVVEKIVNYSPEQVANSALLVSDHLEGYDFEAASNALRPLLPQNLSVTTVNRGNNSTAQVKTEIINGINAGPLLVNYAGHGSTDVWTGAGILSSADAAALTNGNRLPFFISMTCLNGRFQDSSRVSLAEALMKAGNGGAVAVWASSGLTVPDSQSVIDQQLMRLLFSDEQSLTLGDAVREAKQATNDVDVRRTWIFFGDPTMRIR